MKKIFAGTLIMIFAAATFAGCAASRNFTALEKPSVAPQAAAAMDRAAGFTGGQTEEYAIMDEAEVDVSYDVPEAGGGYDTAIQPVIPTDRKIIKNVDLQLQTLAFDEGVKEISNLAASFGGYIQDSYVQGTDMYVERGTRYASFTVRIPVEKLDAFVNSLGGMFNVTSKSENSQDITETYFDSRARLDSLKVQEERLLAMLEKAEELQYMLEVERELMNVRYEIESLTSALARMDNSVSLSTVSVYLQEVVKYEAIEDIPVTFSQRVSHAFTSSWKNFGDFSQGFAVALVSALPFLLLVAVIVAAIVLLVRRGNKKRAAKRAAQAPPYQQITPAYPQEPAAAEQTEQNDGENK